MSKEEEFVAEVDVAGLQCSGNACSAVWTDLSPGPNNSCILKVRNPDKERKMFFVVKWASAFSAGYKDTVEIWPGDTKTLQSSDSYNGVDHISAIWR